MSKSRATLALIGITVINLLVVAASSIFGVYGDGTVGAMPWVLGFGSLWVLFFTYRAAILVARGEHSRGIGFAAKSIPYAFVAFFLGFFVWAFIHVTWP
jgi:hypothetical protein